MFQRGFFRDCIDLLLDDDEDEDEDGDAAADDDDDPRHKLVYLALKFCRSNSTVRHAAPNRGYKEEKCWFW